MPPSESLQDPALAPSFIVTDTIASIPAVLPFANGDEENALARLDDDGGPPPSPDETPQSAEPANGTPEPPEPPSLEQRVRRLEEAVTLLQVRRPAEPRQTTPPTEQRPADRPPEARPIAPSAAPPPTAIRLDVAKPSQGMALPIPVPVPSMGQSFTRLSALWLLWETWAETRAIVRMFVDPRYHLPWSARVWPLVLLAAILTSRFWVPFSSIPFLGDWLLVKLVDLLLAFLLFKWLGHEARRYRQTSPDLPAHLRL